MNTVCKEHKWETFEKRNNSNMVEAIGDFCILCGMPKPKIDFKIKDNLEVIEDNKWDEIEAKLAYFTGYNSSNFLTWLKENYIAPEKK